MFDSHGNILKVFVKNTFFTSFFMIWWWKFGAHIYCYFFCGCFFLFFNSFTKRNPKTYQLVMCLCHSWCRRMSYIRHTEYKMIIIKMIILHLFPSLTFFSFILIASRYISIKISNYKISKKKKTNILSNTWKKFVW